jgi:hypothetical protein
MAEMAIKRKSHLHKITTILSSYVKCAEDRVHWNNWLTLIYQKVNFHKIR